MSAIPTRPGALPSGRTMRSGNRSGSGPGRVRDRRRYSLPRPGPSPNCTVCAASSPPSTPATALRQGPAACPYAQFHRSFVLPEASMSAMPPGPGRPVAESIRLQLGTDALVLITPGPHSCAVVVSSVPGYPSRLTDARAELNRESADDGPRLAYTVTQAARALGLSKSMIYDQLRSRRLG